MDRLATRTTRALRRRVRSLIQKSRETLDHPVGTAFFLLIMLTTLLVGVLNLLGSEFIQGKELGQGAFIEATGAMMDLVIFGLFIAAVAGRRERYREIRSHEELIEDFKKWESEEARHRIGGAIRRLNTLGRTKVDFAGIKLSQFRFSDHGCTSIANSTFFDGTMASSAKGGVVLTDVNFSEIDCREVVFSKYDYFSTTYAKYVDCHFERCKLAGATFSGALLEWTEEPPAETGNWVEVDGREHFYQEYYPPFCEVDLAQVSFEKTEFRNVDFREAYNLQHCNFSGAKGLEDCLFDSEEIAEKVLANATNETEA